MATQFSGGTYVNTTFTGNLKSDIMSNLKTQLATAGWTNTALAAGQGPGNVGTVTITIASPGVVTFTSHGFLGGERIIFRTTGALPTGITAGTVYFVKFIDANTFNFATTSGGSNVNTSGSQSGTHTLNSESILMTSATQANVTNPIRVRMKDNNANCVTFSIENTAGTVVGSNDTTNGCHLLPATSQTFRVIATQYHFLVFYPGALSAGRQFVMGGMLYVPSFLAGVTDQGYLFSNSQLDSSATASNGNIRVGPNTNTNTGNWQMIWNSNLLNNANNNNATGVGCPQLVIATRPESSAAAASYRWANDDINTSDILHSSGLTATSDEGKIKGQFFDMVYIADAFAVDSTDIFNSHDWFNLTNNNTSFPRGGIWVATS